MRSYGQYCSLAKALDVVGDRWNLLIVRELLLRSACRYTDLLHGLPGIATNLLADRLRELERSGIVSREDAPPPIATTLFRLTERGEELEPVLDALARWGVPLMRESSPDEAFRGHWLSFPVGLFLDDQSPGLPAVAIQVDTGQEPMIIETLGGTVRVRPGSVQQPDLTLSGTPQQVLGLLSGALSPDDPRADGLRCDGDLGALTRLLPHSRAPSTNVTATPAHM